ncbi:MAG: (2Fe-2S)-binding protein, partial [Marinosulfonomonas sp.]|nr:(2Fe-2S)-binding protein [Marinosulfonomonas sp.]
EYAALSGQAAALGRDFDISGLAAISDADYANFKPVQWPVSASHTTSDRFFARGGFYHTDGRARMVPVASAPIPFQADGIFHLNSGRVRDQWHTMTRSGKSPRLNQHETEPFAQIHPEDAQSLDVESGQLIEIVSAQGKAVVRAKITDRTARGSVFVPMHWSGANTSTGRVNALIAGVADPVSGQPALKASRVRLRRFTPLWYGFAASVAQMQPNSVYSAVSRTPSGSSCELAGLSQPDNWENEARRVLNLNSGGASQMSDTSSGIVRVAIHDGAKLAGLFFAGPNPVKVVRQLANSRLNSDEQALIALAGIPASGQPDPGRTVCACFNLGINTIRQSIQDGATTMIALGNCTAAGTNCGSCKPELQTLIDNIPILTAAE